MYALLLAALIAGAVAVPVPQHELDREWEAFKLKFRPGLTNEDDSYRRSVFEDNYRLIVQHNIEADNGQHSYRLGVNQFSDMTDAEWEQMMLNPVTPFNSTESHVQEFNSFDALPASVDWRSKGVVAHVKNQGQCGSCWAFAAVSALESQKALKAGSVTTLSEQEIVDCNRQTDCTRGGNFDLAYNTITREGGIESDKDYPYTSGQTKAVGSCKFQRSLSKATIQRFSTTSMGSESSLQQAVANVGPIAVYMDASGDKFRHYASGVYTNTGCRKDVQGMNHGVTAVGYGTSGSTAFWLVRNSWDTTWGNQGYFQIRRNTNECGIGTQGAWPTGVN